MEPEVGYGATEVYTGVHRRRPLGPLALRGACMTYYLPDTVLRRISAILCRESSQFIPSRTSLREIDQRVFALLSAVGAKVSDTEYAAAFRQAANAIPTPWEHAEEFRRIAVAENPLSPEVCSSSALVRLNAKASERWAARLQSEPLNRPYPLIQVNWDELPDWQKQSLREIAKTLEAEYQDRITQGAPQKGGQNALLIDLADIFLSATGQQIDRLELPHAPNSLFIQFVHEIAKPFFPATEISPKALSNRWRRWKRHSASKPRPMSPGPPPLRKRPTKGRARPLKRL